MRNLNGRLAKLEGQPGPPARVVVIWPDEPRPEIDGDNVTFIEVVYEDATDEPF